MFCFNFPSSRVEQQFKVLLQIVIDVFFEAPSEKKNYFYK